MAKYIVIVSMIILGIVFLIGCTQIQKNHQTLYVLLDEEFVLHENQSAILDGENFTVKITGFIYSPCPKGAQCFWSGLGVNLEYTQNGETTKGVNLAEAFGYRTIIIDTDYKTYAKLKITKVN